MKTQRILPLALCLALGSCAVPTGPTVVAVAPENFTDARFASDAAACRASAQSAVDAAAANGVLGLQGQYDQVYAQCMGGRGYSIDFPPPPPVYYGPGPYAYGPGLYYGGYWRRW
jgi:hypothetical protein